MLEVIAYFVVPVFAILVFAYFSVEANRKKERELKKQQIISRVATMKDNYKRAVLTLVEQKMLTRCGQESVYRIANNFFVFQPVSIENIEYAEQLFDSIIEAMPVLNEDHKNLDFAQGIISLFVRTLPTSSAGHTAAFYQQQLPEYVAQLAQSNTSKDASFCHPMSNEAA